MRNWSGLARLCRRIGIRSRWEDIAALPAIIRGNVILATAVPARFHKVKNLESVSLSSRKAVDQGPFAVGPILNPPDKFIEPMAIRQALGVAAWALERGLHHDALRERSHGYEEFLGLLTTRSWRQWADLAGVAPEALELLGRAYTEPPCATHIGWGLARRRHGGAAVRAIDALAAFTGNLGISGGGASYYFGRRTAYDTSFMEPAAPPRTSP